MKLNYKKTFLVGLAFFLICVFWQAYDTLVALTLTNKYGMPQVWSGVIMALDNVLALFMLPLFGALSDKARGKMVNRFGKRTPFVVIGTIVAVVCFFCIAIVDAQQAKLVETYSNPETVASQMYDESRVIDNPYYTTSTELNEKEARNAQYFNVTLKEGTVAQLYKGSYAYSNFKLYADASNYTTDALWAQNPVISNPYYGKNTEKVTPLAKFDTTTKEGQLQSFFNSKEEFADIYGKLSLDKGNANYDKDYVKAHGDIKSNIITGISSDYADFVVPVRNAFAASITAENPTNMIIFIVVLMFVLFAMATFRSPAVALMPAVTIKPLRSKANGIINIMGVIGGSLILGLGMLLNTGKPYNALMNYVPMVGVTCIIMIVALIVFLLTVKEPKMVAQMEADTLKYGLDKETDMTVDEKGKKHMDKPRFISFIFLLLSIFFWFFGYNAITSKYAVYASQVLLVDYNTTLLVAQVAALIAFLPSGLLASKIGRKKTIMGGIVMLTAAFGIGSLFGPGTNPWIMNILFVLAGVAWAAINVNSLPMVVEMATGADVGRYTGFYYTASMASQIITPIFSGALMDWIDLRVLFPYGALFVACSFVTMIFVRHGDSKPDEIKGLQALADAEDRLQNDGVPAKAEQEQDAADNNAE